MGVAVTFAGLGKIEFFYYRAPEGLKSLGTSFFSSSMGIGCFISRFFLSVVTKYTMKGGRKGWILNDLNESHLDYYYILLNALNFLLSFVAAKFYIYSCDAVRSMDEQTEDKPEMEACTQVTGGLFCEEEERTKDGTVDLKGRPSLRSKGGRWISCSFILAAEVLEKITYYGVAANLVVYLTNELHEGTQSSATNVSNWMGVMTMTPIFAAFIADAYLGQFFTIISYFAIYLLGMSLLTITVSLPSLRPSPCNSSDVDVCRSKVKRFQVFSFFFALYIIAIGSGGTKVNFGTFGANQFDKFDPKERTQKTSFFNWWVFAMSAGNLFSTIVVVYVQQNVSWSIGYTIPTVSVALSFLIFGAGTPFYRHMVPAGSPFKRIVRVLVASTRKWRASLSGELCDLDVENYKSKSGKCRINHTLSLRFLDKAAVETGESASPWMLCSKTEVEQTKQIIRLLPIFIVTIMPSVMQAQVLTLFIKQGMTLDGSFGPHFDIPPASLSAVFVLSTLVSLVIYDRWLVPFVRNYTKNPRGFQLLHRIGIGLIMHIIIMCLAMVVERYRLSTNSRSNLTIFILLPQFALMGVAETFVAVGKMEFFYDQAPEGMKSLGTSFFSSSMGIGCFISGFLLSAVNKYTTKGGRKGWILNDLNESHLDYYYIFLAILNALNFLLFFLVAKFYVYSCDAVCSMDEQTEASEVVKEMTGNDVDPSKTLAVIKPTTRGASIPIQSPMLSETNYSIWAVKMKIILRSLRVWSVIEGEEKDDDKDQGAMVAISQVVPDDVMMVIAEKETTKEAWDALREM
ncbi:protein NRT1/ PTR FAMILY 5.2-like [Phalaenopsis equestris]|uniref:protein NRT1/ PTR FAMILY 5.2-like n=1 Tax=Phalaenopsis equestris TaxID=78828 RepID=UPI0009E58233|nr:protein NRT1/ PTR FAMILY 5.2-like [Phalaenopsis equestris]